MLFVPPVSDKILSRSQEVHDKDILLGVNSMSGLERGERVTAGLIYILLDAKILLNFLLTVSCSFLLF